MSDFEAWTGKIQGTRLAIVFLAVALRVCSSSAVARPLDDPPSTWVRELPDGVVVEVVAIGDPSANPPRWWSPAGEFLAEPIADVPFVGGAAAGRRPRVIAVRVQGPGRNPTIEWESDAFEGSSSSPAVRKGQMVKETHIASVEVPGDRERCDLTLRVAAGEWATQAIRSTTEGVKVHDPARSVTFSTPRATETGTAIVVVEDFLGQDRRVVAFRPKTPRSISSYGDIDTQKAFWSHDMEFRGSKPEEIDRYELRVRPFGVAAFKGLPLEPPKP